ncbi:MAG: phosphoenolpyruvate--protein phosphotransferase [Planctomycetes bacterium]|nr:phosphoenolpyruvate--protein phosphotransferase [Planctomycetota bacterium]MBL7144822.1 phosphoenolpyruvate--protein phosphotransferase [Phycisphaerae bacterium]
MDNEQLLYDISQLNELFRDSTSIQNLLDKTVAMVASHTNSDVCSVYLYNNDNHELVLRATRGLNPDSVGRVKLKLGQGLTGLALKELRPICEKDAIHNPNFKFFPGIFEERYECFLAVPIVRGIWKIGVLVLQRQKGRYFNDSDITALEAVTSQLANIIENARFLMAMHEPHGEEENIQTALSEQFKFIKGKAASEGFAYGPATVANKKKSLAILMSREFDHTYTLEDFHKAITKTADQLEELQEQVGRKLSDAASLIFSAHLVILKDKYFVGGVVNLIESGVNPPLAILQVATQYMGSFATSGNSYMQEKTQDIEDLIVRLMSNLLNEAEELGKFRNRIIITGELLPSDLLILSSEEAGGIVLIGGTVTSHLSILARSLRIPMIVSDTYELLGLPDNTPILVDAETGHAYVDPSDEILERFESQQKARLTLDEQKRSIQPVTTTRDGTRVHLFANINLLADAKVACELHCEGVGLYRTEFPFMIRNNFPNEAEQFTIYRELVQLMKGRPITFRTLDMGGDKTLSYYHDIKEQNPALGLRSIRFSLQNKPVFAEQIRAMLRAGAGEDLRIMFPMISSIDEFCQAREVVFECLDKLDKQNKEHNHKPKLGIMVELPCVVDLIDDFTKEADFFSIGTNDFIQFMLGVDRTNENVADAYLSHHPSVLRALKKLVQSANQNGKEISICGDMAHQEQYLPFLLGIGVRTLSMNPGYLLKIQKALSEIDLDEAKATAEKMLDQSKISDLAQILNLNRSND